MWPDWVYGNDTNVDPDSTSDATSYADFYLRDPCHQAVPGFSPHRWNKTADSSAGMPARVLVSCVGL